MREGYTMQDIKKTWASINWGTDKERMLRTLKIMAASVLTSVIIAMVDTAAMNITGILFG